MIPSFDFNPLNIVTLEYIIVKDEKISKGELEVIYIGSISMPFYEIQK